MAGLPSQRTNRQTIRILRTQYNTQELLTTRILHSYIGLGQMLNKIQQLQSEDAWADYSFEHKCTSFTDYIKAKGGWMHFNGSDFIFFMNKNNKENPDNPRAYWGRRLDALYTAPDPSEEPPGGALYHPNQDIGTFIIVSEPVTEERPYGDEYFLNEDVRPSLICGYILATKNESPSQPTSTPLQERQDAQPRRRPPPPPPRRSHHIESRAEQGYHRNRREYDIYVTFLRRLLDKEPNNNSVNLRVFRAKWCGDIETNAIQAAYCLAHDPENMAFGFHISSLSVSQDGRSNVIVVCAQEQRDPTAPCEASADPTRSHRLHPFHVDVKCATVRHAKRQKWTLLGLIIRPYDEHGVKPTRSDAVHGGDDVVFDEAMKRGEAVFCEEKGAPYHSRGLDGRAAEALKETNVKMEAPEEMNKLGGSPRGRSSNQP